MSHINNKHLPSDIDSLTRKDLIEIYHIHVEEYQALLAENERLLNAVVEDLTLLAKDQGE